jgi:hypothetical protein
VVYNFATVMERPTVKFWIVTAAVAVGEKLLVVDTAYIYVVYILVAAVVRQDVIRMHHRLRDMGEFIMNRGVTNLSLAQRRIQSLNPVCRFARLHHRDFPLSRLLMQVNDYDIPGTYASEPPYSSHTCLAAVSLFLFLALLPTCVNVIVTEALLATIAGSVLIGLYNLSKVSLAIPIAIVVGLVVLVIFPFVYFDLSSDSKNKVHPARQRGYVKKYHVPAINRLVPGMPSDRETHLFSDSPQRLPYSRSRALMSCEDRTTFPIPGTPTATTLHMEGSDNAAAFTAIKEYDDEEKLENSRFIFGDESSLSPSERPLGLSPSAGQHGGMRNKVSLTPLKHTNRGAGAMDSPTPGEHTVTPPGMTRSLFLPKLDLATPGAHDQMARQQKSSHARSTLHSEPLTSSPFTPLPPSAPGAAVVVGGGVASVHSDMMDGLLDTDSSDEELLHPTLQQQQGAQGHPGREQSYRRTPLPVALALTHPPQHHPLEVEPHGGADESNKKKSSGGGKKT